MRHALNAKKKKNVFGYDPSEKKRKIAKKNGIKVIYNRKESKNISNDVIICSPSDCHESDLNFCSSFAKKILVEKPFVIDVRNGEKLLKKCEKNAYLMPLITPNKQLIRKPKINSNLLDSFSTFLNWIKSIFLYKIVSINTENAINKIDFNLFMIEFDI